MVSLPLGYFTYSAWISSDGRTVGRTDRRTAAPSASPPPNRPTDRPTVRLSDLPPIAHPPDPSTRVIGYQQGPVCRRHDSHRPPPAGAVGKLPPGDKILNRVRPPVLHPDADDLRARGHAAIPGAVIRHEGVALVLGRELRPRVERQSERRRVRLHGQGGHGAGVEPLHRSHLREVQ